MVAAKVLASDTNFVLDYFFPKSLSRKNSSTGLHSSRSEESDIDQNFSELSPLGSARSGSFNRTDRDYHKEHLDYLFEFVHSDEEVNDVLAGYFEKVVRSLLDYRQKPFLLYFYNNEKNMNSFEKHIYNRSIAVLFEKLLNIRVYEDYQITGSLNSSRMEKTQFFAKFTDRRIEAMKSLINVLHASRQRSVISGVGEIFEKYLEDSSNIYDFLPVFKQVFFDPEVLKTLFRSIRNTKVPKKRAVSSFILTQALFHLNLKGEDYNEETQAYFETKRKEEKNPLIQTFIDDFEDLMEELIEIPEESEKKTTTFGKEYRHFGYENLKLIEFIASMIELRNINVEIIIHNSNFFEICFVKKIFKLGSFYAISAK